MSVAWAENTKSSDVNTIHNSFGVLSITLNSNGDASASKYDPTQIFINHGILMWISWFVLGLSMIFTNRWFPYLTNKSNYIHLVMGYTIVAFNAYAAFSLLAPLKVYGNAGGLDFSNTHA